MNLLEIDRVTFSYASETRGVTEVSSGIAASSLVAVLGQNGSGKSTLLKLLARVVEPDGGQIRYGGRPLQEIARREYARQVGYLPQSPEVAFSMRVLDLVLSGRAPHLGRFEWESSSDVAAAEAALRRCDVEHLADRFVQELSGGERKRVFLARVLASQPRLLLLDEPLAALDPLHVQELLALLRRIVDEEETTVIFVSHDVNWAAAFADRMMILHEGRIAIDGSPADVLEPAIIEKYFGVRMVAATLEDGRRWVIPARLGREGE